MPLIPSETAVPAAPQGTGPGSGSARILPSLSTKGEIRRVLGMRQSYDLLLGNAALLLCASVSLVSLVIPDHFCNVVGVLIIDMRFNSLTFVAATCPSIFTSA